MKYDNYVFDLYGTLVDIRTDEEDVSLWIKTTEYLKWYGVFIKPEEMKRRYHQLIEEEKAGRKDVTYPEVDVIRIFAELAQGKLNEDELKDFAWFFRRQSTLKLKLYDGVFEMLEYIRNSGKKVILLSNAQASFTMPELIELDLMKYLDHVFISSSYGVCKPDKKYWQIMLEETGADPERTVMIGNDFLSDISGAQKQGIDAIYIHQDISPVNEPEFCCTAKIMDGDVKKIIAHL